MGVKYLWDTNTAIYYLQQQFSTSAEKFIDDLLIDSQPAISAITEIELLCCKHSTEKDEEMLHYFIKDCWIIELEQEIKHKTAAIRRKHRIKLPDAIIAASALVYDLILISRNIPDFSSIEGLEVVNPWDN